MVIVIVALGIFSLVMAYRMEMFFAVVIFAFFVTGMLILGPIFIKLTYDEHLKEKAASAAENDLNDKYNLDNLVVWYGVEDFSFTDGKKDCIGKLTKQNGHYDIARKPNGEFKVKCKLTNEVKWDPTYVDRTG